MTLSMKKIYDENKKLISLILIVAFALFALVYLYKLNNVQDNFVASIEEDQIIESGINIKIPNMDQVKYGSNYGDNLGDFITNTNENINNLSSSIQALNRLIGNSGSLPSGSTDLISAINSVKAPAENTGAIPDYTIVAFYGTNAPSGWQICDGSSLIAMDSSAVVYKEGSTYKEMPTPDLRGRVIIGSNPATNTLQYSIDSSNAAITDKITLVERKLRDFGGEEKHKLTVPEMASHSHRLSMALSGSTSAGCSIGGVLTSCDSSDRAWTQNISQPNYYAQNFAYGFDYLESTGGGKHHNNMQPYYVLNYIIKKPKFGGINNVVTL